MPTAPFIAGPHERGPGVSPKAYDTGPHLLAVSPASDRLAGGVAVTLTGYNFTLPGDGTPPTILIGGSLATSVVFVDSKTLTCNAPARATIGTVDVTVTNFHGQSDTLEAAFTYVDTFATRLFPNHAPLTGGIRVIIEGGHFVAGSTITFGGVAGTDVQYIDAQHYAVLAPAHAVGAVSVSVDSAIVAEPFFFTLLTRANDIRRQPGISISERLGSAPNTCSFRVDGKSFPPMAGELIEILDEKDSNRLLFAGVVQTVEQIYEELTDQLAWNVSAVDFVFWLNRRRPFGRYVDVSATEIVRDLCARFAPWVNTTFVQEGLCNITISFDGTADFATCLSTLARLLGGGHWYLTYTIILHFFHVPRAATFGSPGPAIILTKTVTDPSSEPGVGTRMTLAVGDYEESDIYSGEYYVVARTTFIYTGNIESAYSLISNMLLVPWRFMERLTNIPLGPTIGSLACIARRVYIELYTRNGYSGLLRTVQIDDNTTTTLNGTLRSPVLNAAHNAGVSLTYPSGSPTSPAVAARPLGSTLAMSVNRNTRSPSSVIHDYFPMATAAQPGAFSFTPGLFQFRVSNVYSDGTESQLSAPSNTVELFGNDTVDLTSIPLGNSIGGLVTVYRKVYCSMQYSGNPNPVFWKDTITGFWIIPDNSTVSLTASFGVTTFAVAEVQAGGGSGGGLGSGGGGETVGPCGGDGVYLEDLLTRPNDIDDNNVELLRDPPVTSSVDISQIRNRVFVRGAGTIVTANAPIGSVVLQIADVTALPPVNGKAIVGTGLEVLILGVSAVTGAGFIVLSEPTQVAIDSGTVIHGIAIVEDVDAQRTLARVEQDANGEGDGVHETFIDDTSLISYAQQVFRGQAEIELFAWPIVQVNYATRDNNTHPGRMVTFNLTNPPIKGEFLIQTVQIDQIHDESDDLLPRYIATASSVRFDLEDLLALITEKVTGGVSPKGIIETAVTNAGTGAEGEFGGDARIYVLKRNLSASEISKLRSGQPTITILPALPADQYYTIHSWQTTAELGTLAPESRNIIVQYKTALGAVSIVGTQTLISNAILFQNSKTTVSSITNTNFDIRGAPVEISGQSGGTNASFDLKYCFVVAYYSILKSGVSLASV